MDIRNNKRVNFLDTGRSFLLERQGGGTVNGRTILHQGIILQDSHHSSTRSQYSLAMLHDVVLSLKFMLRVRVLGVGVEEGRSTLPGSSGVRQSGIPELNEVRYSST